jgi:hypothetical protein
MAPLNRYSAAATASPANQGSMRRGEGEAAQDDAHQRQAQHTQAQGREEHGPIDLAEVDGQVEKEQTRADGDDHGDGAGNEARDRPAEHVDRDVDGRDVEIFEHAVALTVVQHRCTKPPPEPLPRKCRKHYRGRLYA